MFVNKDFGASGWDCCGAEAADSFGVFGVLAFPRLLNNPAVGCASGRLLKRLPPERFEKMLGLLAEVEVFVLESDGWLVCKNPLDDLAPEKRFDDGAVAEALSCSEDLDCADRKPPPICSWGFWIPKFSGLAGGGPAGVVDGPKLKPPVGLLVGVCAPDVGAEEVLPPAFPNKVLLPVVATPPNIFDV